MTCPVKAAGAVAEGEGRAWGPSRGLKCTGARPRGACSGGVQSEERPVGETTEKDLGC